MRKVMVMTSKGRPLDNVMRADDERYARAISLFDEAMALILEHQADVETVRPDAILLRERQIIRAATALRNNVDSILRGDEPDL